MKKRIAINGFGRIGRAAFKALLQFKDVDVVAINDLTDPETLAYLLRYDTAYGPFLEEVKAEGDTLEVKDQRVTMLSEPDPRKLPWKDFDVDVVLECTGRFVKDGASAAHLDAGAKSVVLSAPEKGEGSIPTLVRGVRDVADREGARIVSNASCTTNCIAPVMRVLSQAFGVRKAMMTTVHSYTANQRLQDAPHRDPRRGRAAAQNIIPTSTGAALATAKVLPHLDGKFHGVSLRVPTIVVSLSDVTALLERNVTEEEVRHVFREAAEDPRYQGILDVTEEPLVSSDFIGSSYSSIVDLSFIQVVDGDMVKVLAWYDNEWGYSNRLVEVALQLAEEVR